MSGAVRSTTAGVTLAWVDGPPQFHYNRENELALERQREADRQKLCENLLAKRPTGKLDSLMRSARIWFNNCSQPAATAQVTTSSEQSAPKPDPKQEASKQVTVPEPRYHGGKF